jgi:hypothetical protein
MSPVWPEQSGRKTLAGVSPDTLLRVGLPVANDSDHTLSALPSVGVRIVAFAAICLSGLAGAVIGYSLVSLQCEGDCGAWEGIGLLVGALGAAAGMAVVAVLVMRAMGEWREIEDRERAGHGPR